MNPGSELFQQFGGGMAVGASIVVAVSVVLAVAVKSHQDKVAEETRKYFQRYLRRRWQG